MTDFELSAVVAGHVSLAFHQNSIPVVSEIKLDNKREAPVADLELSITCEPAVIAPLAIRIDRVAAGAIHYLRAPDLRLDTSLLRLMAEGAKAELTIATRQAGEVLATITSAIQVLPASHWGGFGSAPELLAAFVRPNDPAVDVVLHEASKRLAAAGKPSGLDGYGTGRRNRPWNVAAAVWSALAAQGITYVLPPASFERTGQKVRSPSDVMERRTATCLDTTLILKACFEQAGLDPLLGSGLVDHSQKMTVAARARRRRTR